MPVKSNGEVYFNVTIYREPGSDTWTAEPMSPANPEDEGHMVDLFYNGGTGDSPGEALEQLAVEPLTDEAIEQIEGAEGAAAAEYPGCPVTMMPHSDDAGTVSQTSR